MAYKSEKNSTAWKCCFGKLKLLNTVSRTKVIKGAAWRFAFIIITYIEASVSRINLKRNPQNIVVIGNSTQNAISYTIST